MPFTQFMLHAYDTVSDPLNGQTGVIEFLVMPKEWVEAPISFQVSFDGTDYFDLHDNDAVEVTRPMRKGAVLDVNVLNMKGVYMRVRSGTRDYPVMQSADRTFGAYIA